MRLLRSVAAAALVLAAALPARAETLGDALVSAYNHSRILDQNRALLRVTDENVPIALAALRPVLSWVAGATYSNTSRSEPSRSASLQLQASMLLYDFGASRLGVEVAKESVLATREALVGVEQDLLYSAVQAYMNVISALETLSLQQNNLRLLDEQLKAANDRFELGEITTTDVSLTEAQRAAAQASLAAAQGEVQNAYETYNAVIGHRPGALAPPPSAPQTARTLEQAKAIARVNHPDIKEAQHNVTVAELGIAVAEANMKPSLSATASAGIARQHSQTIDGRVDSASVGLSFSGPIYQGGALSAQYRAAVARRDAARAALLQSAITVEQNVALAWSAVSVAAAQLRSTEDQIRSAQVAYNGVREELSLGSRTVLDALDAEQDLRDAQASRISANSTYYIAQYGVLRAMGLLTADHLRLNVVRYDPEAYYNAVSTGPVRKVSPQGQKLDRVLKAIGKN